MDKILNELLELKDIRYKSFQSALMPTVDPDTVIGVRMPDLRRLCKSLTDEEKTIFLNGLPYKSYEENNLCALILNSIKDADECYISLERFLPHINNWATCDLLSVKAISADKERLLLNIDRWIGSGCCYTVRFGIGMLMRYFLKEDFCETFLEKVADIDSEEYYVKMMCAWYFATALAFRYESTVKVFEERRLNAWIHNKAISKAIESYRVSTEKKEYLRSLRIKKTTG